MRRSGTWFVFHAEFVDAKLQFDVGRLQSCNLLFGAVRATFTVDEFLGLGQHQHPSRLQVFVNCRQLGPSTVYTNYNMPQETPPLLILG